MALSVPLTDKEEEKVAQKRKLTRELPTYFDALAGREVQISREFEAFLILKDNNAKQEAINWITEIAGIKKKDSDKDELIKEALKLDSAAADSELKELDSLLGEFNAFRESFSAGKFASVSEVGSIFNDLQAKIGVFSNLRERIYFRKTYNSVFGSAISIEQTNENRNKQLKSWVKPLSTYTK